MTIFKVRDAENIEEEVEFWLEKVDGDICMKARLLPDGENWYIISITSKGELSFQGDIGSELGLHLDADGEIIIDE